MERVYGMWDGPKFITVAATLWDLNPDNPAYAWWPIPPFDHADRFPLYPLLIRALSPLLGYWVSSLAISVAASTGVTLALYGFLRRMGSSPTEAFWVALVSIFWPPRGLLYRYVTMAEPLFILGILGAAYAFKTRRYLLCGLIGALAVATRSNGFLVVAGFGLMAIGQVWATRDRGFWSAVFRIRGMLLIPLSLGGIYLWDQLWFGDWLASLHAHEAVWPEASLYPALVYPSFGASGEGVPYLFVLVLAGIVELVRRGHGDLAALSLIFYGPSLFVPTDVSRYLLPILPFTFSLAGARFLASVPIRVALLLSLPLVYAYAWTTLLHPNYQAQFDALYRLLR